MGQKLRYMGRRLAKGVAKGLAPMAPHMAKGLAARIRKHVKQIKR